MSGTPENTAKQLKELYFGVNKEAALAEVFNMAKAFDGKQGDMPNSYWVKVFIALEQMY